MNADVVKVFLPISETEGNLCYVTAHIVQEVKRGHYAVYIDDEDWPESVSRERIITLKSLPGMDSLPMQNEDVPETGVDDMASLNFLHEASILDNIRRRFRMNLPYTYTGDICIATNPYHWLDIYTADLMEQHKEHLRQALPPHAYATSATAYRGLRDFAKCQSILVSGESGAGKTETVKILMGHLAHISGKKTDETVDRVLKVRHGRRHDGTTTDPAHPPLFFPFPSCVQANPLMESFGNAKTMRNDNSSRFGKFVQLEFDEFAFLKGSRCVTYLLEKTRVIGQNDQERSFHIFYQVRAPRPAVAATPLFQILSHRPSPRACAALGRVVADQEGAEAVGQDVRGFHVPEPRRHRDVGDRGRAGRRGLRAHHGDPRAAGHRELGAAGTAAHPLGHPALGPDTVHRRQRVLQGAPPFFPPVAPRTHPVQAL
jgi:hypothetical protein